VALALGAALLAGAATVFLLPIAECPSCSEIVLLFDGVDPPSSVRCSPCGNSRRVTPFARWKFLREPDADKELIRSK
jgi:hypothetical protein